MLPKFLLLSAVLSTTATALDNSRPDSSVDHTGPDPPDTSLLGYVHQRRKPDYIWRRSGKRGDDEHYKPPRSVDDKRTDSDTDPVHWKGPGGRGGKRQDIDPDGDPVHWKGPGGKRADDEPSQPAHSNHDSHQHSSYHSNWDFTRWKHPRNPQNDDAHYQPPRSNIDSRCLVDDCHWQPPHHKRDDPGTEDGGHWKPPHGKREDDGHWQPPHVGPIDVRNSPVDSHYTPPKRAECDGSPDCHWQPPRPSPVDSLSIPPVDPHYVPPKRSDKRDAASIDDGHWQPPRRKRAECAGSPNCHWQPPHPKRDNPGTEDDGHYKPPRRKREDDGHWKPPHASPLDDRSSSPSVDPHWIPPKRAECAGSPDCHWQPPQPAPFDSRSISPPSSIASHYVPPKRDEPDAGTGDGDHGKPPPPPGSHTDPLASSEILDHHYVSPKRDEPSAGDGDHWQPPPPPIGRSDSPVSSESLNHHYVPPKRDEPGTGDGDHWQPPPPPIGRSDSPVSSESLNHHYVPPKRDEPGTGDGDHWQPPPPPIGRSDPHYVPPKRSDCAGADHYKCPRKRDNDDDHYKPPRRRASRDIPQDDGHYKPPRGVDTSQRPTVPKTLYSPLVPSKVHTIATQHNISTWPPTTYPQYTTADGNGTWIYFGADGWTTGFFPSTLYALAERVGICHQGAKGEFSKQEWVNLGRSWATGEIPLEKVNHQGHDVGFLSFPFVDELAVNPNNVTAQQAINTFATQLAARFNPIVGCTRSWDTADPTDFQVIIDNMMNLEVLYQSYYLTHNQTLIDIARKHADTTMKNHIREDGGTWHVVEYNSTTGEVIKKRTAQGYSDSSTWSRGQAWGIYGFANMYLRSQDFAYLNTSRRLAKYFLDNTPSDWVVPWDFNAPLNERFADTSASTIAANGLLLLAQVETLPTNREKYINAAINLLSATTKLAWAPSWQSLLSNGTVNHPANNQLTGIVYGDYYYITAGNTLAKLGLASC